MTEYPGMYPSPGEVVVTTRYVFVKPLPSPAAGADWQATVPGGYRWRLKSITALLTAAVAVANRIATLWVSDGTNPLVYLPTNLTVVASTAVRFTFMPVEAPYNQVGPPIQCVSALPGFWLPSGYAFGVTTQGIQAADQWSGLVAYLEQEITGPPPPPVLYESEPQL